MERTPTEEIIIMPPTGGNTGRRNADLTLELGLWNRQTKLGVVFDSSTVFNLPKGGDRSPDASWLRLERWNSLTQVGEAHVSSYGTTIVRRVEMSDVEAGAIEISYFYPGGELSATPEVSTIIAKIYN